MTNQISGPDGFASRYAEIGGFDPDLITELFLNISSVNGVTASISNSALLFSFSLDNTACPFLYATIENDVPDIYLHPSILRAYLPEHGRFPFEADHFLDGMSLYLDSSKNSSIPYDADGKYYLDTSAVLDDIDAFTILVYRFIHDIFYHD